MRRHTIIERWISGHIEKAESLSSMPKLISNSRLLWLLLAALVTVALCQLPFGNFVLYPFTILSTWFYEMGYSLTAIVLGGRFEKLMVFSNGSGLAYHSGYLALGAVDRALVSVGPIADCKYSLYSL